MAAKLLVRTYNVGCGDCIYVGIPNGDDRFHMLIDCGSKESERTGFLQRCVEHIEETLLSDVPGETRKRLDLLVITHRHEDHIKGINATYFDNIQINNIWVTAGMNEDHPQAQGVNALHNQALKIVTALRETDPLLSPELNAIDQIYGIGNPGATNAILRELPETNGIEPKFVHAGMTSQDLNVNVADTLIEVLAPEQDIDGYYLGEEATEALRGLTDQALASSITSECGNSPTNIGGDDFAILKSRMLSNALSFVAGDSKIQNNVSTVLLITWKGRRLLFVGDAEWSGEFREGKSNGSWNVMWHERQDKLATPIDFLKVGHHGSHNSTPWNRHADSTHEVNQILDSILPLPAGGETPTAQCVVSTKRKQYETIPDAELLTELGRRTVNTRNYLQHLESVDPDFDPESDIYNYSFIKTYSSEPREREVGDKGWLDKAQPLRTDLESVNRGNSEAPAVLEFVDVELT